VSRAYVTFTPPAGSGTNHQYPSSFSTSTRPSAGVWNDGSSVHANLIPPPSGVFVILSTHSRSEMPFATWTWWTYAVPPSVRWITDSAIAENTSSWFSWFEKWASSFSRVTSGHRHSASSGVVPAAVFGPVNRVQSPDWWLSV
jgi:hypothetical protein